MNKFYSEAISLDQKDPLAKFRKDFVSDGQTIYLDGNSLGRLPEKSMLIAEEVIRTQWGQRLIRSWNEHWLNLSKSLSEKIAKIVGAREDEIWLGDTTSLNLFKLAYGALEFQSGKNEVLTDDLNFPTDLYILQGLVKNHFTGHHIKQIFSQDGISISREQIKKNLNINTALLTLSLVTYKSAFMYDMDEVNKMANDAGSLVLWDLSHAAGAVPVYLNKTKADLAVGCTYKYLNGGPGAPAFLYVRKDLTGKTAKSNLVLVWPYRTFSF
ncbi:MAG: aminotransferase class V-fold PLP-dependent enzyme [Flavobacteriaceae bacterium]|nr:aminotransferase class V-fold PLP-dependent enzyme [Flavobacteriaceae bacterium]